MTAATILTLLAFLINNVRGGRFNIRVKYALPGVIVLTLASAALTWYIQEAPGGSDVKINPPPGGQIALCAELSGTAILRTGETLWLAQTLAGAERYFWTPVNVTPDHNWNFRGQIGDPDQVDESFEFRFLIIESEWSAWMKSLLNPDTAKPMAYMVTTALAPHRDAAVITLPRNSVTAPCPT
ncbi:hypothetical protein [Microbispora triticiradicis]|uniref:hypothetical protein n=1 Tax=Microbispora triticiradicis TaxID=2200763 RepID=UPI001AD6345B|nr:hypothetical protein [Microbispora triticiradicis]MBO4269934.1 hypothetical protein [Microbispora triticiradicis]